MYVMASLCMVSGRSRSITIMPVWPNYFDFEIRIRFLQVAETIFGEHAWFCSLPVVYFLEHPFDIGLFNFHHYVWFEGV